MTNVNFTCLSDFQALSFRFCGQLVYISRFPSFFYGVTDIAVTQSPGCYFVHSVVCTHDGRLDVGVEYQAGSVEYYPYQSLEILYVVSGSEFIK